MGPCEKGAVPAMTLVLAADTSTQINTVALCRGEDVLAEATVACRRLHSERLVDTVDWVLSEAGIPLEGLDLLAVAQGPGSFTGLRIGAATFKGLALGADLPLLGVPTLAALSRAAHFEDTHVCPLLDARMQEVFCAAFTFTGTRRSQVLSDCVCPVEHFLDALATVEGPVVFLGDGATLYRDAIHKRRPDATLLPAFLGMPSAAAVAREALAMLEAGAVPDAMQVAPVYLRASQAEQNRAQSQTSGKVTAS